MCKCFSRVSWRFEPCPGITCVPRYGKITVYPIGKHLFLGTDLASVTHTSRAQGRKKKRTKRDSLLEEKGRADEESEDGHRHGPAFRYRGHPSKHTTNRENFSDQPTHPADPGLLYFPERATYHGGRSGKGEGPGETLTPGLD